MTDRASRRHRWWPLPLLVFIAAAPAGWIAAAADSPRLPQSGIWRDDFASSTPDSAWMIGPQPEHRDDRAWSLVTNPGQLTIVAQDSDIHTGRSQPINYFLREVQWEDFEITTGLSFAARENFEHAGLIVWHSADDYIKLAHLFADENRLEAAIEANGRYSTQQIVNRIGDELHLRIRKVGRRYTYLYSSDGEQWQRLGSGVMAGWSGPKVGLLAVSPGSGRGVEARFEYFSIRGIDPADDAPRGLPADTGPVRPGSGQVAVPMQNPVYLADIPDPGIVRAGGWFYVVGTQSYLFNRGAPLPILKSRDLVNWEHVGNAFDGVDLPAWVNRSHPRLWAPDVIHREQTGRYYLYFSAQGEVGMGIGVGFAEHPQGPYTFLDEPLVIGHGFFNIDPHAFLDDDGTLYMYWGSAGGALRVQEMSADGLSLIGEPREVLLPQPSPVIIDADRGPSTQDESLVEAPWVIKRGDHYYMFYSGNSYHPGRYSLMVARANSPLGPFDKHGGNPILTTNEHFSAPGHNSLIQDDAGQDWIVYHAYLQSHLGFGRALMIDRVDWVDGWPVINGGNGPSRELRRDGPIIGMAETPHRNIAAGAVVTASSELQDHPAAHAVDGDTSTRWSPARIDQPQWLHIDLGGEYQISRTQILFRSARAYIRDPQRVQPSLGAVDQHYQYRIEHSIDGSEWELYADRTDPQSIAYPYLEHKVAIARHMRITVTGYAGHHPNKNVYQVKIFGRPSEQPATD